MWIKAQDVLSHLGQLLPSSALCVAVKAANQGSRQGRRADGE